MTTSDEKHLIHTGFVRQRRNLIAISLLLLAFQGTGATIDVVNVFGNTIRLDSPLSLSLPLWIAWAYFLIRYYQYLHDLEDRGVRQAYLRRMATLLRITGAKFFKRTYEPDFADLPEPRRVDFDIRQVDVTASPPPWVVYISGFTTGIQSEPGYKSVSRQLTDHPVTIPSHWLLLPRLRSAWWVLVHTRLITEYGLPFVVALAPIIYVVTRRILGL